LTYEEASARTVAIVDEHVLGGGADRVRIGELLRAHCVRLVAAPAVAAGVAGQEMILTMTLLVRRMGMGVEVVAADAPLLASGPPFEGATLHDALCIVEDELLPGTQFAIGLSDAVVDIEFVLGSSAPTGKAKRALRLGAKGSRAVVAGIEEPLEVEHDARLAALATSGIAAAQAFRSFAARLADEFGVELAKDFSFDERCAIDLAEILGVDVQELLAPSLGRVDFISAGAITNSALYTLLRIGAQLRGRVIERKEIDPPDLNRYLLVLTCHLGLAKVAILTGIAREGVEMTGIEVLYTEETRAALEPLASSVMVGVDHVPSRWLVQSEQPERLVIGATEGFEALVSFHRLGLPCAGCLHPTSPPNEATRTVPTISFVSFFSGFFQALALSALATGAEPPKQVIRVLPFAWAGVVVQVSALAANAACPVGCAPSRILRAAA
jgi:hypothetical protein